VRGKNTLKVKAAASIDKPTDTTIAL